MAKSITLKKPEDVKNIFDVIGTATGFTLEIF